VIGRAPEIWIGEDIDGLAREGARRVAEFAKKCISLRGRFVLALAGGNTPRRLYKYLAGIESLDWRRVEVFFSDERMVPHDSAESNYRMARETLLDLVPIPRSQVHAVPTQLPIEEAASEYEKTLRAVLAVEEPRLDLALLGMGADGHTASIFPNSRLLYGMDDDFLLDDPVSGPIQSIKPLPSLEAFPSERLVAAVTDAPKPPPERVTMTPYILNLARYVVVLVAGDDKVAAVSAALESDARVSEIPIKSISPGAGDLVWLLDRRAARALGTPPM
jgi:6-phosphogluconolactonase